MAEGLGLTPLWQDRVEWLLEQITEDERLAAEHLRRTRTDCTAKRELIAHLLDKQHGGHMAVLGYLLEGYADRVGYLSPEDIQRG